MKNTRLIIGIIVFLFLLPQGFALEGGFVGDTIEIKMIVDQGRRTEVTRSLTLTNDNDFPVIATVVALSPLNNVVKLNESFFEIEARGKKEVYFTASTIKPGLFSGTFSALMSIKDNEVRETEKAAGRLTNKKSLSQSIIINAISKENATAQDVADAKKEEVKQVTQKPAGVKEVSKPSTKESPVQNNNNNDEENEEIQEESGDSADDQEIAIGSEVFDEQQEEKGPNPIIGGLIFLAIVVIGGTIAYVVLR